MAHFNSVKQDVGILVGLFPKGHKVFQITAASVDELTCRFILAYGIQYTIHANCPPTYPSTPPIWFTETENSAVTDIVHNLANTSGNDNNILKQIQLLVKELCEINNLQQPTELSYLQNILAARHSSTDIVDRDSEFDEEMEDYMHIEADEATCLEKPKIDSISIEYDDTLKRLSRQSQWDYGSVQATNRLLNDLREVHCSESYKTGFFKIELANLYFWNVKLLKVDPNSKLHTDLRRLTEEFGKDGILLNILFTEAYPFEPPLIRLISPKIGSRHVLRSGAISMEFLTNQGWSSVFTVETIIMQIAETLVKGKVRIKFDKSLFLTKAVKQK